MAALANAHGPRHDLGARASGAGARRDAGLVARAGALAQSGEHGAREPLAHFLLIGLATVAAVRVAEARSTRYRVDIGSAELQRLSTSFAAQYGALPSGGQRRALIAAHIREEVFLREARALGLDRDDEIVRRRLAQKYEYLLQDELHVRQPGEAQLRDWFLAHRSRYTVPARRTFDQLYYATDERGEAAARGRARAAAQALAAGRAAPATDDFPGAKVVRLLSEADTARLFGDDAFAAQAFAAPPGRWAGPFRSGFGWHVLRVTEALPARARDLADARDDVRRDWQAATARRSPATRSRGCSPDTT